MHAPFNLKCAYLSSELVDNPNINRGEVLYLECRNLLAVAPQSNFLSFPFEGSKPNGDLILVH